MAVRLGSATIKVCSIRILISVLYSFNSIESEIEPNLGMLFYNQRIFARTVQKKGSLKEDESVKISVPMRFLKKHLLNKRTKIRRGANRHVIHQRQINGGYTNEIWLFVRKGSNETVRIPAPVCHNGLLRS